MAYLLSYIWMKRARWFLMLMVAALAMLGLLTRTGTGQAASQKSIVLEQTGVNPGRKTTITVQYTQYNWWLIRWVDNLIVCPFSIDHEGLPTRSEILARCGQAIYNQWKATPPCQLTPDNSATTSCTGLYLFLVNSQPAEKSVVVELPLPQVTVSLSGCTPTSPENLCDQIPSLLLTGEEPLPNEHITAIHATMAGKEFSCEGNTCEVPLQPTPLEGLTVSFWADSSYGDTSNTFTALVRVVDSGVSPTPGKSGWYVDVISSQWTGRPLASCAQTWEAFPPLGGPPAWLSTPEVSGLLATEEPYYFLAGRLISQGQVDTSECPNGGILSNGYADACGLAKALPQVQAWQNQFDQRIIQVAQETGVPAQLMKNLFAQESQFWPGMFNSDHIGLGHITDNGAESLLLWNPSFYDQFCPLMLDASVCAKGYVHLDPSQQALLRGALALQAKTDCPNCQAGIDLTNANFSIGLFAQTLLADCEQVGQEVYNATKKTPGSVSSYEDLWRFTLANYHAGPGCLSYALYGAAGHNDPIDWSHVQTFFTPVCQGVVGYVDKIAK